jgi:hypothetical protein
MTKDSLAQLIEQCKANETNLLAQLHRAVGSREALEHVLNEMNKPADKPKAKRGRKPRAAKDEQKETDTERANAETDAIIARAWKQQENEAA